MQCLDNSGRLQVLIEKSINDICNKPGGKNNNRNPYRGQRISVIAKENLKLAAFLFHHRLRCTFDWEVREVHEDTNHPLAGKKSSKIITRTQRCYLRSTRLT